MKKIIFETSASVMSAGKTAIQQAAEDVVNNDPEIQAAAVEVSEKFRGAAREALEKAAEGYAATAVWEAVNTTPRYMYTKNFEWVGKRYYHEIDLLFHLIQAEPQ